MRGLLDLPNELLYEIIDHVASPPFLAPPDSKRYRPEQMMSRAVICYAEQKQLWWPSVLHLLLTCRVLHSETALYLSKKLKSLEIDVAIVDDHWIWPTWYWFPPRYISTALGSLKINLIPAYTETYRGSLYLKTFESRETNVEMLKLVSQLLLHGFLGKVTNSPSLRLRDIHIAKLVFNINIARHTDTQSCFDLSEIPCRRIDGLAHLDFEDLYPVDPANCIVRLDWLKEITNHDLHRLHYGLVIRERVDRIVFVAGDYFAHEIDIVKYMKDRKDKEIQDYREAVKLSRASDSRSISGAP